MPESLSVCSGLLRSSGSRHRPQRAPVLRSSEPLLLGSDCSLVWVALDCPCCHPGPVSRWSSLARSFCGLVSCSPRFLHSRHREDPCSVWAGECSELWVSGTRMASRSLLRKLKCPGSLCFPHQAGGATVHRAPSQGGSWAVLG